MSLPPPRKKMLPPKKASVHIQNDLIAVDGGKKSEYTGKILAPIYEPKNKKPHLLELVDCSKSKSFIAKIIESDLSDEEKQFLIIASYRHNVFNYKLVADYYSHASAKMQDFMEQSALVIIDFDKAIQNGYVKFSEEIKNLYIEEYEKSK